VVDLAEDETENDDRDWLGAIGRVIFLLVTPKLTCDTEAYFSKDILADIRAPNWANVWPTTWPASSTVPDQTVFYFGAMRPS
jgi:hypothetical protein